MRYSDSRRVSSTMEPSEARCRAGARNALQARAGRAGRRAPTVTQEWAPVFEKASGPPRWESNLVPPVKKTGPLATQGHGAWAGA